MKEDTKQRLISAAGRIFAQRGFEAASIREICAMAESNIAAVNYHFGDKQKLYLACLSEAASCHQQDFATQAGWENLDPRQQLRIFITSMLETKLQPSRPHWHLELMLREMAHPTENCARLVESYIKPMADALRTILNQLAPGPQPHAGWLIGFSIVGQILFYYVNQPVIRLLMGESEFEQLSVEDIAEHITRFCLTALGHDSGSVPHLSSEAHS